MGEGKRKEGEEKEKGLPHGPCACCVRLGDEVAMLREEVRELRRLLLLREKMGDGG